MNHSLAIALAALGGAVLPLQVLINARLRQGLGNASNPLFVQDESINLGISKSIARGRLQVLLIGNQDLIQSLSQLLR